ncbi:MAG: hypothetical protein EXR75_04985 [Myxococcales bacterium]|nr:hypothetical protein [Myxococcales bacterium]
MASVQNYGQYEPLLAKIHRFCIAAAFASTAQFAAGCGHAASEAECEEIFRRSAEIQLKSDGVSDAAEIAGHVANARDAKGIEQRRECVGKRITDEAMACVRIAESSSNLDGCLR